jgi:hypothetical protein
MYGYSQDKVESGNKTWHDLKPLLIDYRKVTCSILIGRSRGGASSYDCHVTLSRANQNAWREAIEPIRSLRDATSFPKVVRLPLMLPC